MFTVYDSNKPAKFPEHPVHPSWHTASFKTMTEARAHAKNWLGRTYEGVLPKDWDGSALDYSGCGDTIEIRKRTVPRFDIFDICVAWYLYARDYHGGQFSKLYKVLGRLERVGFRLGISQDSENYIIGQPHNVPEEQQFNLDNCKAIYQSLVERKVYQ